ncbi:putative baseplate assembly protein [Natrinema longum]|uniref:Putative baseplate assembly protein n=1 Tax=Natrinema longum TaxID=370324 RepID=A0A8A2UD19_9EURY|nr:putative baseplate assembly protein [Natrinema longum]MBZ6495315.1 putative baseplate assembly protein [Natrinema longum]QSW86711.1 putative baseplate assembly protein [Natrinema longum]
MSGQPIVDDRDQEALYAELQRLADQYTDSWDPGTDDNATVLLRIFSQLGADVIRRLNDVPAKHRIAFLDALGFDRRPPQAARLPLTFEVSTDIDRNVAIPGGTQAVAEPGDGATRIFEIPQDEGFEATGASLTDAIAVDPADDRIVDHGPVRTAAEPVELLTGENVQEHVLYLAHDDLLNLEAGSPITITAETTPDSPLPETDLVWEYYGEDDDTEGWYPLEERTDDESADDDPGLDALQERLQSGSSGRSTDDGRIEREFRLPGKTVQHAVDGVESRWLRCRIADDDPDPAAFSLRLRSISASVGRDTRDGGLTPDSLLSNDVPLSTDEGDIRPLGRLPQPPSTFYVASEEAFTKRGGVVEVRFDPPAGPDADPDGDDLEDVTDADAIDGVDIGAGDDETDASPAAGVGVLDGPPTLSWEYWTGSGWSRLTVLEDETNALRSAGHVRFTVPEDIEPTSVSGHENVWIRVRLVSGNYGQPSFGVTDAGTRGSLVDSPDPPRFGDVSIQYDRGRQPFERIRTKNNGSISDDLAKREGALTPFEELSDETQTLYLGFDEPLRDGPLTFFVPIEDVTYPRSFDPGMRWEYCEDPAADEWSKLTVQDRTGGLTERGIVRLTLPEPTTAFDRFGRQCHWIRARVTQDEFDRRSGSGRSSADVDRQRERTTAPPTLEGLYPNTQWAYNTRTIEDEVLGSSDGSHDQSFDCAHAPVIDLDLWVEESATLSTGQRRELLTERPDDVRRVTDAGGDVTECWVRWQQVADFLESEPSDRHYVVDRLDGTVSFGDGNRGRIPPSGQGNIMVTYTTGGGRDGNVAADTITDLKSSISLVEDVSNPKPADGGADAESMDALVARTTGQLKHRGRAVTPSDYERVATAEFRELSKVNCTPDGGGDGDAGGVTLLIVPHARREKPVPSMELKHRVRDALRERAPVSLVESEGSRIVVRGPQYAAVSVSVTVYTADSTSVSLLKGAIEERIDDYLHPLDGNGGEGWSFGQTPSTDALYDIVDGTDAVADVVELGATIDVAGEQTSLAGRDAPTTLPPDVLVCSGVHEVTVTMGGDDSS